MSVVISLYLDVCLCIGVIPKMCTGSCYVWEVHTFLVHYLLLLQCWWPRQIFFYLPYCHLEVARINTCIKKALMLGSPLSLKQFWFLYLCCFSRSTWLFYCAVAMQQCCSGTAVWISYLLVEGCLVWRWWHVVFVLSLFLMHLNTQDKTALGLWIT